MSQVLSGGIKPPFPIAEGKALVSRAVTEASLPLFIEAILVIGSFEEDGRRYDAVKTAINFYGLLESKTGMAGAIMPQRYGIRSAATRLTAKMCARVLKDEGLGPLEVAISEVLGIGLSGALKLADSRTEFGQLAIGELNPPSEGQEQLFEEVG